ncbi:S8 family peptidase [Polycladidibacter stylochi]|uniref:S8 family peptidase n=1 Tax=Polycladidibacter stylochi TaxID=1807766 RepID=UPI00082FA336|nr:S8 family peptidase [Pseudovibrio stylochi]
MGAYEAINLAYAHAQGLTGSGKTIAIVDGGFLEGHQEFRGKKIDYFGPKDISGHGTSITSLAAGRRDGRGMVGVAPGAGLHLAVRDDSLQNVAAATQDAADKGAIVQNNSWLALRYKYFMKERGMPMHYTFADLKEYQLKNKGMTTTEAIINYYSYIKANKEAFKLGFTNYIEAVKNFTKQGVVVFGVSNEHDGTKSVSLMAGLPKLYGELQGKWLVVPNAVPVIEGVGKKNSLELLSTPCHEAAEYCIIANGFTHFAYGHDAYDVAYYTTGYGSSQAAPQVSGAVALLSEAFPKLKPEELVSRLLATANTDFSNFTVAGTVDFGKGIKHDYSSTFGHGMLDLKAALQPVGGLGVATTKSTTKAVIPVAHASIVPGDVIGSRLSHALLGQKIAVFDGLGTDFYLDVSGFLQKSQSDSFEKQLHYYQAEKREGDDFASFSAGHKLGGRVTGWQFAAGLTNELSHSYGLVSGTNHLLSKSGSIWGFADKGIAFSMLKKSEQGTRSGLFGFVDATHAGQENYGFGGVHCFALGNDASLTLGMTSVRESRSFMGMHLAPANDSIDGFSSFDTSLHMGAKTSLLGVQFEAVMEAGVAHGQGAGFVSDLSPALYSGFGLKAHVDNQFTANDRLSFVVRQPLRLEQGTVKLKYASGRTRDAKVIFNEKEISLVPEARQLDFGVDYEMQVGLDSQLRVGASYSLNADHERGKQGGAVLARFTHRF